MSFYDDHGVPTPDRSEFGDSSVDSSVLSTPPTESSLLFGDILDIPFLPANDQYILVVGGLGYIGSHTTWELIKDGYNVIIIDNLSNSFRSVYNRLQLMTMEHFKSPNQHSGPCPILEFFEADYRDLPTMTTILERYSNHRSAYDSNNGGESDSESTPRRPSSRIRGVIHFAGYKAVNESIQHPLKYYSNNVGGLIDLCSLLSAFNIKTFVFSSSATVYGELARKGGRLREDQCTHQPTTFLDASGHLQTTQPGCTGLTNPYGRTKWMCEAILHDLVTADPDWTVFALRYFNPIGCDASALLGEDPRIDPTNLIPVVIKVLTNEVPALNLYGSDWDTDDGSPVRDFIHVTDLARGHLAALDAASRPDFRGGFRVFNLGSGQGHSVLEVVKAMEAVSGRRIPTRAVGRREGDVGVCIAEPSRAEEELRWKARKSLEECCADICRFLGILPTGSNIVVE